ISLDFRNAPLDAVLEHLSEAAGFAVVKDGAVDGRVTVVSRQPVSPDEAVTLLNAVLKSNGFAAVRNGRVLRVSARDVAKKQNLPVRFGADPADVPATDELVTQVIPVGSVDAVKLRQDLAPILGTEADVAANGGSNALIVTDTSANVRRVVQIIAALDRHEPGSIELRRYPLKHADAAAAVKLILGLLKPPDQQVPKAPDPNRTPFDQALRGRVAAVADDRTNTLFVTAPAATLGVVDGIVKDLEANPTAAAEIKIFSLKFADAASAAKLIAGVFRPDDAPRRGSDGEVRPRDPAEQALRARVVAQADDRTNTLVVTAPGATMKVVEEILTKLDADPSSTSEIKVFPLNYADAASAAKLIVAVFRPPEGQTAAAEAPRRYGPAAETPVTAKVIAAADDRTNSVVINAPPETIKAIEKVLQVLDANPAASATVKSFPLKHADAASAVSLLNTLFGQTPTLASTAAAAAAAATSVVPAASGRARLTAAYDSRTNTVIVQAPAELITAAEAVIRDLE
ncbi:MAG TPA: secretin N-terminal domain-containing protein, partial [Humisphaera sp.]